MVMIESPK